MASKQKGQVLDSDVGDMPMLSKEVLALLKAAAEWCSRGKSGLLWEDAYLIREILNHFESIPDRNVAVNIDWELPREKETPIAELISEFQEYVMEQYDNSLIIDINDVRFRVTDDDDDESGYPVLVLKRRLSDEEWRHRIDHWKKVADGYLKNSLKGLLPRMVKAKERFLVDEAKRIAATEKKEKALLAQLKRKYEK